MLQKYFWELEKWIKNLNGAICEDQFGFRSRRGTREATIAFRMTTERRLDKTQNTIVAFIDQEKGFDMINWVYKKKGLHGKTKWWFN